MRIYSARPGSPAAIAKVKKYGLGLVITPGDRRRSPHGIPWMFDNGAYSCWINKRAFDSMAFTKMLMKLHTWPCPDFGVVPDVVAAGLESLKFSVGWLQSLPRWFPWYVAVQDGITRAHVEALVHGHQPGASWTTDIAGIFVGGTRSWKWETAESWVNLAHSHDLKCHIGGVGGKRRLVWARRIGADSVDSTSWARNGTYHFVESAMAQRTLTET